MSSPRRNLQRQVLFGVSTLGEDKVKAAAKRLKDLNPDCKVIEHKMIVNSSNVHGPDQGLRHHHRRHGQFPHALLRQRRLRAAEEAQRLRLDLPLRRHGHRLRAAPDEPATPGEHGPCYRCMYPEPPDPGSVPSCAEGGVIGVLPGIIGTLQANEVIKLILGIGTPAIGKLTTFVVAGFRIPDLQAPPRSELPGLRRSSDDHQADRLRAILRRPRDGP